MFFGLFSAPQNICFSEILKVTQPYPVGISMGDFSKNSLHLTGIKQ
jgi:hypothetical protein